MSGAFVLDASIAIAWVHPGQGNRSVDGLLADVEAGTTLVVPALWFVEVANALLTLERRKRLTSVERREALDRLTQLRPSIDGDEARSAFTKTSDLAVTYGLSVYDATYLELARRRRLPLATLDAGLRAAAGKSKVRVLP